MNVKTDFHNTHQHDGINVEVDSIISELLSPISGDQDENRYHQRDHYAEDYGKPCVIYLLDGQRNLVSSLRERHKENAGHHQNNTDEEFRLESFIENRQENYRSEYAVSR